MGLFKQFSEGIKIAGEKLEAHNIRSRARSLAIAKTEHAREKERYAAFSIREKTRKMRAKREAPKYEAAKLREKTARMRAKRLATKPRPLQQRPEGDLGLGFMFGR